MAESVLLFGSLEDVNHAHCTLPDVMELHDEAVTVRTMALSEAHIAAFTEMWHSNPTVGNGEPHTPPFQTPPSEETPCCLHAQLGDLKALTHRMQIRSNFNIANLLQYCTGFAPMLFQWSHSHRQHFFAANLQ